MGFVQIAQLADETGSVFSTFSPGAFGSANTPNNRLVCLAMWIQESGGAAITAVSVTDTVAGNVWIPIGSPFSFATSTNTLQAAAFECLQCVSGTSDVTVHFTATSPSAQFIGVAAAEYSGASPTTPSYGVAAASTVAATTSGPAAVTLTALGVGDILVAWGCDPDNDDVGGVVGGNTQRGAILGSDFCFAELVAAATGPATVGLAIGSKENWASVGFVIPTFAGIAVPFWAA